jgi:DNA-directed RNA polymerase subunit RPC12/RpoP
MAVSITCPICSTKLNAPEKPAGTKLKCPKCGGRFTISPSAPSGALASASKPAAAQSNGSRRQSISPEANESLVAAVQPAAILPAIQFTCSECGAHYDVEGDLAGKVIRCRNCHDFQRVQARIVASSPDERFVAAEPPSEAISPRPPAVAKAKILDQPEKDVVEGLELAKNELRNTRRKIRRYRWQCLRKWIRLCILRAHKAFLETFGLANEGWLAPSLVLAVPAFALGAVISLALQGSLFVVLLTATLFFAVTSISASLFYLAVPYESILKKLDLLRDELDADRENIRTCKQDRNALSASIQKMKEAELEVVRHRQIIEDRRDREERTKIERLRLMLGYQQVDPWGSVAIFFSASALVLAVLGLFTCGITYWIAIPFAFLGLLFALASKSQRRSVALTLALITFLPLIFCVGWTAGLKNQFKGNERTAISQKVALKIDRDEDEAAPQANAPPLPLAAASPTKSESKSPSQKSLPTKSEEPEWHDAKQGFLTADYFVCVTSASIREVTSWEGFIPPGQIPPAYLVLFWGVSNESKTKKLDYNGDDVRRNIVLKDNFGNQYKRIIYDTREFLFWNARIPIRDGRCNMVGDESIHPGKELIDFIIFERPLDNISYLRLEVADGARFRLPHPKSLLDGVRFQIPKSMIAGMK